MLSFLTAGLGVYLLLLSLSPSATFGPIKAVNQQPKSQSTKLSNRLIIPKINIDLEYKDGGPEVLNEYIWHRFPERGDPIKGGNMILSAHRFELGWSPGETRRKSPFYNIHRLEIGDEIAIYYDGKEYKYEVMEKKTVSPLSLEIEAPTSEPILTIYSCTFRGEHDGREVVLARPI